MKNFPVLFLAFIAVFFLASCEKPEKATKKAQTAPEVTKKDAPAGHPQTMPNEDFPGMAHKGTPSIPFLDIKVEKAQGQGACTIAEIYEKKDALNQKEIKVKGHVTKISPDIMGKNWIHIQDGTGSQERMNYDLTVTSSAIPKKDEVIVIRGKLSTNKDFGFGYFYDVILEDAQIEK